MKIELDENVKVSLVPPERKGRYVWYEPNKNRVVRVMKIEGEGKEDPEVFYAYCTLCRMFMYAGLGKEARFWAEEHSRSRGLPEGKHKLGRNTFVVDSTLIRRIAIEKGLKPGELSQEEGFERTYEEYLRDNKKLG